MNSRQTSPVFRSPLCTSLKTGLNHSCFPLFQACSSTPQSSPTSAAKMGPLKRSKLKILRVKFLEKMSVFFIQKNRILHLKTSLRLDYINVIQKFLLSSSHSIAVKFAFIASFKFAHSKNVFIFASVTFFKTASLGTFLVVAIYKHLC